MEKREKVKEINKKVMEITYDKLLGNFELSTNVFHTYEIVLKQTQILWPESLQNFLSFNHPIYHPEVIKQFKC